MARMRPKKAHMSVGGGEKRNPNSGPCVLTNKSKQMRKIKPGTGGQKLKTK